MVGSRARSWRLFAVVLAALALAAVAVVLVVGERGPDPRPGTSPATSTGDPAGEWSGDGTVTRCAGLDEGECSGTRSITLTIDCLAARCSVTPFDASYGRPPLRLEDGAYSAVGPLPEQVAPECGGVPTTSGRWTLRLTLQGGRLTGTYEESTIQGFDCGATDVVWTVGLERG